MPYYIAASDSSAGDKAIAQLVCDGIADDVEIQSALNIGRQVTLLNGTYTLAAAITIPAGVTLMGTSQSGAVLNVGALTGANAIVVNGQMQTLKVVGDNLLTASRKIALGNNSTISGVWVASNTYGIETAGAENISISNVKFTDIHSTEGWASCIHAGAGTNGVTIDGVEIVGADRGIEAENGAANVIASNGTIQDVFVVDSYSFVLDAHSHVGKGTTSNISFDKWTLTNCDALTATSDGALDRIDTISWSNVTIINPRVGVGSWGTLIRLNHADNVTLQNIDVTGLGALALSEVDDCTNVVGLESVVVHS